jgi:hypothetical protein
MGRRITLNLLFSLTVSSTIKGLLNAVKDLVVTLLGNAVTCVDEVQFGRSSSYLSASLGHAIASPSSTLSSSALDFAALHGVSIAPRVTFKKPITQRESVFGRDARHLIMTGDGTVVYAVDRDGYEHRVHERELGATVRAEQERHVALIATLYAADAVDTAAGAASLGEATVAGAAAHLGVHPDVIAIVVKNDRFTLDVQAASAAVNEALSPPCGAALRTTALACAVSAASFEDRDSHAYATTFFTKEQAVVAAEHCAMAVSSISAPACRVTAAAASTSAETKAARLIQEGIARLTSSTLPCSKMCTSSLRHLAGTCGAVVLRLETSVSAHVGAGAGADSRDTHLECTAAVMAAQSSCGNVTDSVCYSFLEATPRDLSSSLASHADTSNAAAYLGSVRWSEQSALGVVPSAACALGSSAAHIDLRGNKLVGTVPDCMWSKGATDAIHLSRNMLSGSVGALGAHVRHLHVGDNRFSGSLDASLSNAAELRFLDVSHNRIEGSLGHAISSRKHRHLTEIFVENNQLSGSGADVSSTFSALSKLRAYDISGNAAIDFRRVLIGSKSTINKVQVHVLVRIHKTAAAFCPQCSPEVMRSTPNCLDAECGATQSRVALRAGSDADSISTSRDMLDALRCTVAAHSGVGISNVRAVRVTPWSRKFSEEAGVTDVTAVTLTVTGISLDDASVVAEALKGVGAAGDALRRHADCASFEPSESIGLLAAPIYARTGCANGVMGTRCSYFCPARWERANMNPVPAHRFAANTVVRKLAAQSHLGFSTSTTDAAKSPVASAAAQHGKSSFELGRAARRRALQGEVLAANTHVAHEHVGKPADHFPLASSLKHCSGTCRGHANIAIGECGVWLQAKGRNVNEVSAVSAAAKTCHEALRDVETECGVTALEHCASGRASYKTRDRQTENDEECEVCGILLHFRQHARPGEYVATYLTPFHEAYDLDARRRHAEFDEDATRGHPALALDASDEEIISTLVVRLAGGESQLSSTDAAKMVGKARADLIAGRHHDEIADTAEDVTDAASLGLLGNPEQDLVEAQFPTCHAGRASETCTAACAAAAETALIACISWISSASSTAALCGRHIGTARGACRASGEAAACIDPIAQGFHELGAPGAEDSSVEQHKTRSLLASSFAPDWHEHHAASGIVHDVTTSTMVTAELLGQNTEDTFALSPWCSIDGITGSTIFEKWEALGRTNGASFTLPIDAVGGISCFPDFLLTNSTRKPTIKLPSLNVADEAAAVTAVVGASSIGLKGVPETILYGVTASASSVKGVSLHGVSFDGFVIDQATITVSVYGAEMPSSVKVDDISDAHFAPAAGVAAVLKSTAVSISPEGSTPIDKDFGTATVTSLEVAYSGAAAYGTGPLVPDYAVASFTFEGSLSDGAIILTAGSLLDVVHPFNATPCVASALMRVSLPKNEASEAVLLPDMPGATVVIYPADSGRMDGRIAAIHAFLAPADGVAGDWISELKSIPEGSAVKRVHAMLEVFSGGSWTAQIALDLESSVVTVKAKGDANGGGVTWSDEVTSKDAGTSIAYKAQNGPASINLNVFGSGEKADSGECLLVGSLSIDAGAIVRANPYTNVNATPISLIEVPAWGAAACDGTGTLRFAAALKSRSFTLGNGVSLSDAAVVGELGATKGSEAARDVSGLVRGGVHLASVPGMPPVLLAAASQGLAEVPFWISDAKLPTKLTTGDFTVAVIARFLVRGVGSGGSDDVVEMNSLMRVPIPCQDGRKVTADAKLTVNVGFLRVETSDATAVLTCGGAGTLDVIGALTLQIVNKRKDMNGMIAKTSTFDNEGVDRLFEKVAMRTHLVHGVRGSYAVTQVNISTLKTMPMVLGVSLALSTKHVSPEEPDPDGRMAVSLSYVHPKMNLTVAGNFPIGRCEDPGHVFNGALNLHLGEGIADLFIKARLQKHCPDYYGDALYEVDVYVGHWDIVPDTFSLVSGHVGLRMVKKDGAEDFSTIDGNIRGTIGLLGASSGELPDMGPGILLSADFNFTKNSSGFHLRGLGLKAKFQIESVPEEKSAYFRVKGQAEFNYPCRKGDRIGAEAFLTVRVGEEFNMTDFYLGVYFYCGETSIDEPRLHAWGRTTSPVTFVKGFTLDAFHIDMLAYKNGTAEDSEWFVSGSVGGKIMVALDGNAEIGAEIAFMFDTRSGTWAIAASIDFTSPSVNATLKVGHSTECTAAGSFLRGELSIALADGYLEGEAYGVKNCGQYVHEKGAFEIHVGVPYAEFYPNGMLIVLEDVRLTVRGVVPSLTSHKQGQAASGGSADASALGGSYDGADDAYDPESINGYNPYDQHSHFAQASVGSTSMHARTTLVSSNGRKLLFAGDRSSSGEAYFARLGSADSEEDDSRTDRDPQTGQLALDLDWEGEFTATAHMAFGEDVENPMMSKMLGIIKANVSFATEEGAFAITDLQISVAVRYTVPAAKNSWQLEQGKSQVFIQGIVKLDFPGGCPAPVFDKVTNKMHPQPMVFGQAKADLAMGSKSSPILIHGALCEIAYYCHGSKTVAVKIGLDYLQFGDIKITHIKLEMRLVEDPETGGWQVNGLIQGALDFSDDDDANTINRAALTVIFDTSVPFVSLAYKHMLKPSPDVYIEAMVQLTVGDYCNPHHAGNSISAKFVMDTDNLLMRASAFGVKACKDPEDRAALRYNLTFMVEEFRAGPAPTDPDEEPMLILEQVGAVAVGRGVLYKDDENDLGKMDWTILVGGKLKVNVGGDGFKFKFSAFVEVELQKRPQKIFDTNATDTAEDGAVTAAKAVGEKEQVAFKLTKIIFVAKVYIGIGDDMDNPTINITAGGRYRWPCRSTIAFYGSLSMQFGEGVDLGAYDLSMEILCPDVTDALGTRNVYVVSIVAEGDEGTGGGLYIAPSCFFKKHNENDDVFAYEHTHFLAQQAHIKAEKYLAALRESGVVPETDIAGCVVTTVKSFADVYAGRVKPRLAYRIAAVQTRPMVFGPGSFTVSGVLVDIEAHDKIDNPPPAMMPNDKFPNLDSDYFDISGRLTATVGLHIDATTLAARQVAVSSAMLSQAESKKTFEMKAEASMDLQFFTNQETGDVDFTWNHTILVTIQVKSDGFEMMLRGEYKDPCDNIGTKVDGMFDVDVPGSIELHAAIHGSIFCEDAAPRLSFSAEVNEMIIADAFMIRDVLVTAEGYETKNMLKYIGKEEDMEWVINVTGSMDFDKLLGEVPNFESDGTEIKASASFVKGPNGIELLFLDVDFDMSFKVLKPNGTPMATIAGHVEFSIPCTRPIRVGVTVTLDLGAIKFPPIEGTVVSHCSVRDVHLPILEAVLRVTEPVKIGELFELAEARVSLDIYRSRDGSEWFFASVVGRTNPHADGALNFNAQINATNENNGEIELVADITGFYVAENLLVRFAGRVDIGPECVAFDVEGFLSLSGDLPLNATMSGNMACPYIDEDTGGKVTNMTFLAIVRSLQLTPDLRLEDVGVAMSIAMRSGGVGGAGDGDVRFEINITGTVRFDNAASAGGGASVGAHVSIFTTLAKYDWCANCPVVLGKLLMEAGVNVTTPEFVLLGSIHYAYPCQKGDVSRGMANMDVTAGDLAIRNFTVVVKYFCDAEDSMDLPSWTLEAYANSPLQITEDVTIDHLKLKVSLYNFQGETYAAGVLDGHVEAGSAGAAALGVSAGERMLPHQAGWRNPAIHGDWGVHNHWVFSDKPRARHLMHPDAIALGLGSAPRHTSTDATAVAEVGGVKVKAKFIFDTRHAPPLFGAQVETSFTAGCVNITIGVLADTACDAARPMELTGKFVFDCGAVQGEGTISGSKWCDDGFDHPLYRMQLEVPTLSMGDLALRDFLAEVLFVYPEKQAAKLPPSAAAMGDVKTSSELDWNFSAIATLDITTAKGMPSLPKSGFDMSVTAAVTRNVEGIFSVILHGNFTYTALLVGDTPPTVVMKGSFDFLYPCEAGDSVGARAKMQINVGNIQIKNIAVDMQMYCEPLPGFPAFLTNATLEKLQIETFTVTDLEISVEGFELGTDKDTGMALGMGFIGTFKGTLVVEAGDLQVGASVYFVFDSIKGTILIAIEVNIEAGAVQMQLAMQVGTGDACDAVKGNYVRGSVRINFGEDRTLVGTVRGTAHCPTHPDTMRRLGRSPRETCAKFNEMRDSMQRQAASVAYAVANEPSMHDSQVAAQLNATNGSTTMSSTIGVSSDVTYPQYELMIDIAEFEIADGLMLEGASMHMWSTDEAYNEDIGAATWAWEVYGAASYNAGGKGSLAADGLSTRVRVAAAGSPGAEVNIIANMSLAMKFGEMALNGWGTAAIPCAGAGMVARLELSLGATMPGVGGQKASADAIIFCQPDEETLHAGDDYDVAFFRADLAGLVSNDMFTFSKLAINAFVFASDNEQHVRGSVVGEVNSLSAVPGLSFGATISINTKEELVVLDVNVVYDSSMITLAVRARVPLSGCDRTGWRLTGDMTVNLGDAGKMAVEVNGTKLCHPEATKLFGYTWRVAFALKAFELNMGGAELSLTDVEGDFKGRSIGDALTKRGGESALAWSGSFSATMNLDIAAARLGGIGSQRAALGGSGGMVPGGLASSGFKLNASVALKLADSRVVKGVFSVGVSMITEAVEMTADMTYYWPKGSSDVQIEGTGTFRLKGLGAGTSAAAAARLGAGGLVVPLLHANFSLMYEPGPDGCDMSVFANSGGEMLKVGDLDLGQFDISAFRYQAHGELPEGWKGTIASSGGLAEAGVTFDTRTGAFSVEARVKIDLGLIELEVFGKYESGGCAQLGGQLRIKEYPEFKFSALYDRLCAPPKDGELAWSVNATAEKFTFVEGITLEFANVAAYSLYSDGEEGPVMIIIHAKLAVGGSMPGVDAVAAGGKGSKGSEGDSATGGPALTVYAEISEAGTTMSVTGEFALYFGEGGIVPTEKEAHVSLVGQVDFTFPCPPGGSITASLALNVNMPDVTVDGATATAVWYCLSEDNVKGIYPADCDNIEEDTTEDGVMEKSASTCGKTAEYAADVNLIQVGAFAVKDLHIALATFGKTATSDEYMTGVLRGTIVIGPLTIGAAVLLDTRPKARTVIDVSLDVDVSPGIRVSGGGRFTMPCSQMGDMRVNVTVVFSDVAMAWLDGVEAIGTYESDCGDQFKVEVMIDFSSKEPAEISEGVKVSFGAVVTLLIKTMPLTEEEAADGKTPDMLLQVSFMLGDNVDVAIGVLMAEDETTVSLGIHIQETTMADMFKQMDKVVPGSNVAESDPMHNETDAKPDPELGDTSSKSLDSHPTAHAAARFALSAQLGEGDVSGLGDEIDVMVIPETHILFEFSSSGSMSIFIAVHDAKVFNLGLDIVLVVTCKEGAWTAFAYLGFTDITNGWLDFPQPWTWLSAIANIPIAFLTGGSALKAFGIKFASDQMMISDSMVAFMPVPIPVVEAGVDFLMHIDVGIGGSPITQIYMSIIKMIAGDCVSPLSELICKDMSRPGGKEFFVSEQPIIPTQIEVGHTFISEEGVAVTHGSSETQFRWMSIKIVIGITLFPPSFMAEVEVKAEIDFPSTPGAPPVRAVAKVRIRVMITTTYLELEASLMMKLKTKAQIWANPFGSMPHMGIVFPLALGFGVRIYYAAPPMITYFEFEVSTR